MYAAMYAAIYVACMPHVVCLMLHAICCMQPVRTHVNCTHLSRDDDVERVAIRALCDDLIALEKADNR